MSPRVTLIAATQFVPPEHVPWHPLAGEGIEIDGDEVYSGDHLAEFAGRACYQSWTRPNPATATNAGYIAHILDVAHLSVLEHGSVSFYIEGVSRSLTHELVRHRHFSYSQLSQRYVDSSDTEFVFPPEAEGDAVLVDILDQMIDSQIDAYDKISAHLMAKMENEPGSKTDKRKRARQTARAVLANYTETKIVVTGNYRAWRHFVHMRATMAADREIRALAVEVCRQLQVVAPASFGDFVFEDDGLGGQIVTSTKGVEFE